MGRRCPQPGGGTVGCTVLCHARGLVQCVLVLCVAPACTPCISFSCNGGGGETVYRLDRLPFGWKYSPTICQFALSEIVTPLIPKEIILLHCMDDFLLIGPDPAELARVTALVAEALRTHGFIVSPKSTLSPVERIFFLGKWLDLSARTISSHPRAFLQMLSAWLQVAVWTLNYSRLVGKLTGFMQWHVRPRLGTGPLFAGSYCWMRWGDHSQALPLKVLEGLATTMALAAEEWRLPVWSVFQEFDRLAGPVCEGANVSKSVLSDRVICVDAAWDLCRYRVGGLIPGLGARTWLPRARITKQAAGRTRGAGVGGAVGGGSGVAVGHGGHR